MIDDDEYERISSFRDRLLQVNEEISRLQDLIDNGSDEEDLVSRIDVLREEQSALEYDLGDDVIGLQGYCGGPS